MITANKPKDQVVIYTIHESDRGQKVRWLLEEMAELNECLCAIVINSSTCLRMLSANPPNVEGARETARRTIRSSNRAAEAVSRLSPLFIEQK